MLRPLVGFAVAICLLAGLPLANQALATNEDEARVYLDKATAAYALNRYAIAAQNFEKAFELKPDPALLYNAAQAYRLAGNKERALELYESYLRVYGKKDKHEQIEARIRELKQAIDHDKAVATSPPVTTLPISGGPAEPHAPTPPPPPSPVTPVPAVAPPPPPPPAPAAPAALPAAPPPPETSSSPVVLTQTSTPPANNNDEPLTKKPLFWVAVGGGVAAAVVVVLLLTLSGSQAASPSIGRARGN
jgi:hypothetical protein